MSVSRVQFIKISRLDQNGVDQSTTLNEMSQITIPYTVSGNQVYIILSRSAFPTYFLFTVDLKDPETSTLLTAPSSQNNPLNYTFKGRLSNAVEQPTEVPFRGGRNESNPPSGIPGGTLWYGFSVDSIQIIPFTSNETNPPANSNNVNEQFFNSEEGVYTIGTLPRQNIVVIIPVFNVIKSGGVMSGKIGIFLANPERNRFVEVSLYDVGTANTTTGKPSRTVNIPIVNFQPGDSIVFGAYANGQNATPSYRVTGTNSPNDPIFIDIAQDQSLASGSNMSPILEPYLIKPFEGSDCDVLLNNVDEYADNPFLQDIDFGTGIIPTNALLIAAGTAAKGKVPESRYTFTNLLNPDHTSVNSQPPLINAFGPVISSSGTGGSQKITTFGNYEGASYYNQNLIGQSISPIVNTSIQGFIPEKIQPITNLNEQYSGGTYTGYFSNYRTINFAVDGGLPAYVTTFFMKYVISNEGEAQALTPDSGSVAFLERLYGSNANPAQGSFLGLMPGTVPKNLFDINFSESFTSFPQPRTSALFFTTPGTGSAPTFGERGDDGLEYYGISLVKIYGDGIVLQVLSTGSAPNYPLTGFAGCVFPSSIELTTAKTLPGRTLQILTDNNIILPNSQL